jgi:hypothetical protein
MNAIAEPNKFAIPQLNEGEIYAGAIIAPDGIGHHVILLDGDHDDASWSAQMEWAASIGGDLPDRVEQALLYKHLSDRLQQDAYWSNTQHSGYATSAWSQHFSRGDQGSDHESFKLRARAVRRSPI